MSYTDGEEDYTLDEQDFDNDMRIDDFEDWFDPDELNETDICPRCNGSGEGQYDGSSCDKCKGSGEVPMGDC